MLRDFKFLTTAQVAERLGVSVWTAGKLIRERAIARYRLFEHYVVHEADLLAYMSKQRQPALQQPAPRFPNMRRDPAKRRRSKPVGDATPPESALPAKAALVLQPQPQETTI